MELPPKALHALIDIKKELLSKGTQDPLTGRYAWDDETPPISHALSRENVPIKVQPTMRRAKASNAFQRGCQRHTFWSPVH